MAYYSTPYNYNFGYSQPIMPMYPQQQLIEQTQMLPTQMSGTLQNYNVQNGQTNSIDSYMVWVQGKAGAQSYPVARGTTLPLFDTEGDFVYIKSVDNNGVQLPLVTKILSDPKEEPVEIPKTDMSEYVTKERYDELHKKYTELETRILDLETKPSLNFTGNTFNNTRKEKDINEKKFTI